MKTDNLTTDIAFRAKVNNDRSVEFVISTDKVDSHGTIIPISAWRFDRYLKNPIVTYGHSMNSKDPDAIIGTSTIEVLENELRAVVTFEPEDVNPLAEKILKKIKLGTLKMASVGFRPIKWHWGDKDKGEDESILYFDEVELLEWSIVPVGSNPDAFKRTEEFLIECKGSCQTDIEESTQFPERRLSAEIEILNKKLSKIK